MSEEAKIRESITVNRLVLANRLVMPPMDTQRAQDGYATQETCEYYRARSGAFGLIIAEHEYISPEGKGTPKQLAIDNDSRVEGLARLVDAVHSVNAGATKVFSQINHAGRAAGYEVQGQDDIDRLVDCFAQAARRAQQAGFDGVEIHSAHGYLLNQFYSPAANRRTDEYGPQSMESRTRMHVQVIRAVRETVGDDYPVAIRFGAGDYGADYENCGGSTEAEAAQAALIFARAGVDMLDISGGMSGFRKPGDDAPGWFKTLSAPIKSAVSGMNIPVILTGGIKTPEDAEQLLAEGAADMIGIGRPVIADPDWASKALA